MGEVIVETKIIDIEVVMESTRFYINQDFSLSMIENKPKVTNCKNGKRGDNIPSKSILIST